MKFSTIALALSTIVAPSMGEYVCHSNAFFTFDATTTPSIEAQKFLASSMVDAFNDAYASVDDITMDGEAIETVSSYISCFVTVVDAYASISILSSYLYSLTISFYSYHAVV